MFFFDQVSAIILGIKYFLNGIVNSICHPSAIAALKVEVNACVACVHDECSWTCVSMSVHAASHALVVPMGYHLKASV